MSDIDLTALAEYAATDDGCAEEVDSAIAAVRHPDAPYDPAALTLASEVERLRAEVHTLRDSESLAVVTAERRADRAEHAARLANANTDTAAAERDEARRDRDALRGQLDSARFYTRNLTSTLAAVSHLLDKPYANGPAGTPLSRVETRLAGLRRALGMPAAPAPETEESDV